MVERELPEGFVFPDEDPAGFSDNPALAAAFGWVEGNRVVYSQLPHN